MRYRLLGYTGGVIVPNTLCETDLIKGDCLGRSPWLLVDQDMIDSFGTATRDVEPLHMDPEWCLDNSPYGKPIAYGFQTMSLLTHLFHTATGGLFSGGEATQDFPLNYGFNNLRLLSPVTVGSEIQGTFILSDMEQRNSGELLVTVAATISIKGKAKPALIADWLMMWVTDEGRQSVMRATHA